MRHVTSWLLVVLCFAAGYMSSKLAKWTVVWIVLLLARSIG